MENKSKNFRVLSIDGGGIKGLLPIYFLDLLEKSTKKPVYDLFDFFSGTSIGGIISIFFSQRICTAGELLVKFLGILKNKIFPSKRILSFILAKKSIYDPKMIEEVMQELFKEDGKNISFNNAKGNFLITGSEIVNQNCQPFIFTKYNNNNETYRVSFDPQQQDFFKFQKTPLNDCYDLQMWEIGRITSAAHPFFSSYNNIPGYEFLDGGYTYNNPSFITIKFLQEIANINLNDVFMLSLGCSKDTSNQTLNVEFLDKHIFNLGSEFISNLDGLYDNMNNSAYSSLMLADSYLKKKHIRIAPLKMKDISLDNVDNQTMIDLQYISRKIIRDFEYLIKEICKQLGDFDTKQILLMSRVSKYFFIPRFFRYKEFYKDLDSLFKRDIRQAIFEKLMVFDFPPEVSANEKIVRFPRSQIISWFSCECSDESQNYSIVSLALIVGHLDIIKKYKNEIGDPFKYTETKKWTPFHYCAANGELIGLMILLEDEYLVPGSLFAYPSCCNINFKDDLPMEKYVKLRDAFISFRGKKYNKKTALSNKTPLYYAHMYERHDIIYFFNILEGKLSRRKDKKK